MHLRHCLAILFFAAFSFSRAEDWPQWRGIHRDAKSAETGLLKEWPQEGPKVLWQVDTAGVGYSSVSVAGGKIFTMGDLKGVEHILALDEKTGKLLWAVQPEPVAKKLNEEVDAKFSRFDQDGDGVLSELEALNAMGPRALESDAPGDGTPAEVAAARSARYLAWFDLDKDGRLDPKEIPSQLGQKASAMDKPGERTQANTIAEARVALVLRLCDADGDGQLSPKEVDKTALTTYQGRADREKGNKDGQASKEELLEAFKQEAGKDGVLTAEEMTEYFQKMHPGEDGTLTKEDFKSSIGGFRNDQGDGPRGTPTVEGKLVYAEGGNGDVTCVSAEDGSTIWHRNLVDHFGGGRPGWGYSESPLIVGDELFVTPGGKQGTVAALNKKNGSTVWQSSGLTQGAHYSSPILAALDGKKQIVQFGRSSVFGVHLQDGALLWEYANPANGTANCSTPIADGDYVLASSAYGVGGGLAKISGGGAGEVWFDKSLQSHHGGLVKVGDYVYGFGSGGLLCIKFLTGETVWRDRSVGKGSVIFADGHLYCLGERHEIALVEASPEKYIEKGRFRLQEHGRPSWAHPVIANGVLYLRDQNFLTAYDIKS